MRRTSSFRRDDDKMLYLVKESVRRSSMSSFLVEAESVPIPEDKQVKYRTGSAKALEIMAGAMKGAGFEATAAAMTKGAALLRKNINVDEEEDEKTASLFALVPVLMSSLLSFLTSIATQASVDDKGDAATLEEIYSTDGVLDLTLLEKLISKNFKPNPGFMKWLKASKLGTAVTSGADWAAKKAEVGAAAESLHLGGRDLLSDDLFSSKFDALLQEGPFDFLKNLLKSLWSSTVVTSKTTVQSLVPLLGTTGIHKLLMQDMKKGASTIEISAVKRAFAGVDSVRSRLAAGSPRPPAPSGSAGDSSSDERASGTAATPAAVATAAADVDVAPGVAGKIVSAFRDAGASSDLVSALVAALKSSSEPKAVTAAASRLSDEDIARLAAALRSAGSGAAPAEIVRAAAAAPSTGGGSSAGASDDDPDLDILDDLPGSGKIIRQIKKAGGGKAPKALDAKISGDDDLKRALDLAGHRRRGTALHESGHWVDFLFEDTIDPAVIDKLKLGAEELGPDNEIDDTEAGAIAQAIKAAGAQKKRTSGLEAKVAELQGKVDELRGRSLEAFKDSQSVEKLAGLLEIDKDALVDLLKKPVEFEQKINEIAGKNNERKIELEKATDRVRTQAEIITRLTSEKESLENDLRNLKIELKNAKRLPNSIKALTEYLKKITPDLGELGDAAGSVLAAGLEKLKTAARALGNAGKGIPSTAMAGVTKAASGVGSVISRLYTAAMDKGPNVATAVRNLSRMFIRAVKGDSVTAPDAAADTDTPAPSTEAPAASGATTSGPSDDTPRRSTMKLSAVLGDTSVNKDRLNAIKSALDDPSNVSIVVNLGDAGGLSDYQKGKIKDALGDDEEIKDAEAKVKRMVSNLFTAESRYRYPTDEIIVERWQRLAGIIK